MTPRAAVCGNGTTETSEGCDDGNTTNGDGCNQTCQIETPTPVCGNGEEESGEGCDDSNTASGDGCSAGCQSESVNITVNLTEGETVKDQVLINADATSATASIKRLILTSPLISDDTNIASDTFDVILNTTSFSEDTSLPLIFYAQDQDNNEAYLTVNVLVDNTPNITSFGTSTLIQNGGSASLAWVAGNYTSLSIDNSVGSVTGDSGSTSVTPSTTTTYTLTATRTGTSSTFTATGSVTIQVNYNPSFDGHTTSALGQDPSGTVTVSWSQSDTTDGLDDTVTATVTLYEGSGCLSTPSISSTTSTTGSVSISADTLDPRTDYSYTVALSDSNGGTASTSVCKNFTTGDTGLVGWWRFDEGSGSTAADSSGESNNGTLNGSNGLPTWASGVSDGALQFDGTDDYITLGDNDDFDFGMGDFTLSAWVKSSENGRTQVIIDKREIEPAVSGYILYKESADDNLTMALVNSSNTHMISTSDAGDLSDNAWHHVAAVREGSEVRLYTDGLLVQTAIYDVDVSSSGTFTIGCNSEEVTCQQPFNGPMDEVAVYSRALSTQEIRDFCQLNDPTGSTCSADDVPAQLTPSNDLELPPTRAFLSWEVGSLDPSKTFDHYQLCYATAGEDITSDLACLNPTTMSDSFSVLEDLTAGNTGYRWKVKTCYTDTTCSDYSPVWSFSTDDSLVGWWKFDETSGITAADSSGNVPANDGTLCCSAGWTTGGFLDGALDLSNGFGYVEVPEPLSANIYNPFTVSAWVNMSGFSASQTWEPVVYADETAAFLGYLSSDTGNPNAPPYPAFGGDTDVWLVSGTADSALLNTWHYLTGTYDYDTTTGSLFVDGSVVQSDSEATDAFASATGNHGRFRFMSMNNSLIDEVALYDKALSDEEVLNSYCAIEALAGADLAADGCL